MKKKILIIEDEKSLLELYQARFEKAGYQVLSTTNGKPGIEIAKKEKPDIILLDILMPGVDGYEVIRALKKDPQTKNIPILVFSNLGQPEEIEKGLKLGANDYVMKTDLTPTELLEKVERMLIRIKEPKKKIKKRVLIIEDEKEIARLYQTRLAKAGFEVEVAENGAWGLRLASHGDFDIILLDMIMPAMDGYEVLKQLKKDLRTKKVPVLVFSNSAQDEEIAEALEMGAEDYFLKTKVTPAEVAEEVKRVLKKNNV
jgi:DNA-binding response OmpR family regulator